jgi:hypothetical protein
MTTEAIHAPPLREWNGKHSRIVVAVLAAIVLVATIGVWAWTKDAERRALLRMAPDERAVLYRETRASTESLCKRAEVDSTFRTRCLDSAQFLLVFPECDDACHAFARQFTAQPSR